MDLSGGYARVPNRVLQDETLSWQAKLLYCVGTSFLKKGETAIFPSYKTLAKLCGFCRRTAIRAAQELSERGLWQIVERQDDRKRFDTNHFIFVGLPAPAPSDSPALPSAPQSPPSAPQSLGVVHHSHLNKNQLEQEPLNKVLPVPDTTVPPPSREAAKRQRIADALFDFFHRPATRDQVDDLLADVEEYRKRGIKVSAAEIEQATKDARRWWDSTSRTGNPCRIEPVRKALSDLVAPKQDAPAAAATAAPVPDPLAESTVELRPMWEIWEEERAREAARIPRIPPHLVPLLMKGRDLTPEQQAECDEQERRWQAQQREFAKPIPHVRMLVRDGAAASSASVN